MKKKNFIEMIAGVVMKNIPARGVSNWLFQQIQHLRTKKDVEKFSAELKERIEKVEDLSQYDLLNLGTALYAAFESHREYKQGWVIDGYWAVYDRCNSANKKVISAISGW